MATLSDAQLRSLVEKHFSDLGPQTVDLMFRIAKTESGGEVSAKGDNFAVKGATRDPKARYDYGVMQINSQHGFDAKKLTTDPEYNMRAARQIYDKQGPQAWSTYQQVAQQTGTNMAGPLDDMTPEQILALLQGGDEFANSNLPAGYSYNKSTGQYFKSTPTGVQPVSAEEVAAAITTQARQTADAETPENWKLDIDPANGEAVWSNPRTKEIIRTGEILGQPEVDARTKFLNEQAVQGFNAKIAERQQAIDLLQSTQDNVIEAARDAETGKSNRAVLKESARATNLKAAVDQYNTALGLIPEMGQLSIEESKRVGTILNSGGDYLARAFESRGGTSPLAAVLQADQINAVTTTLNALRQQVNDALAGGPVATDGSTGMGSYEAPVIPNQSSLPAMPGFNPPALQPASQASGPRVAFGPATGSVPTPGGSPASESVPGTAGEAPYTGEFDVPTSLFTPPQQEQAPYTGEFDVPYPAPSSTPSGFSAFLRGPVPANDIPRRMPWDTDNFLRDVASIKPATYSDKTVGDLAGAAYNVSGPGALFNTLKGAKRGFSALLSKSPAARREASYRAARGYEDGGYTHDEAFVGNEKGPELFLNPTNAPIAVVDAETTKQMMGKGRIRGFATGTISNTGPLKDEAGFQSGSLPGGGGYYRNADGSSGTTGTPTPQGQYLFLQQFGGLDRERSSQVSGFRPPVAEPEPTQRPGYFPMTKQVTQQELVEMARRNSPPAVAALFGGTPLAPPSALKSTVPGENVTFRQPTARQWLNLSPEDQAASSARANLEFNAGPGYIEDRLVRQYGSSGGRSKGFVGAMGL